MKDSIELTMEAANELLERLYQQQQHFFFSQKELFQLTRESVEPILIKTCEDIAQLMDCERVELWLFNEEQTKLTAETGFDSNGHTISAGHIIRENNAPLYFASIVDHRTLAVDNIKTDPVMHGLLGNLSNTYTNMQSMIDASMVLSWGVGGVLCCFSEKRRHWTTVHRHVLASVADMFGFVFDRLHRQEVEDHVYELAYTDTLTGLHNQHAFHEKVMASMKTLAPDERGIFLYFVIDQFTDIQSVLGFDAGEQVLIEIAQRLKLLFPDPAILTRIGFDHFVVYSPIQIKNDQLTESMKHIVKELRKPLTISGHDVYVTYSYGVAYYPEHVRNVKEGLQASQIALKNAGKKASRKANGIYQLDMHEFMKENLLSEMNLSKGLDSKQFRLFYQPQVQCETGEIIGFEALIRWMHPERGLIYPGDFINLAESTGLITQIGEWVIKEAFEQLNRWQHVGKGHLTVSINVSPRHFLHPRLPGFLMECAKQTKVPAKKLMIEITENVALEDREAVKNRIIELRKIGFSISIDDFGTGYSAFVYLQDYPIQQIKIDRQFVKNIKADVNSKLIVKTIVQLGKILNLRTVAEGVEQADEWELLKEMECDEIQGFYFSKPLPIDEINAMLGNEHDPREIYLP